MIPKPGLLLHPPALGSTRKRGQALINPVFKDLSGDVTFTRASAATYFDVDGVMQTALTNVPRFGYLQDGSGLSGLLIEGARTNVCLHSSDFSNWGGNETTIVVDQAVAPDGTTTMDQIVNTTANDEHHVERTGFTISSGTIATMSCFARVGTEDVIVFWNNVGGGFCTFDLDAVTASGDGTITALANDIFYCECPYTPGSDWTQARIYVRQTASYIGTTDDNLYLSGAQIEAGAFATSYIATVLSAVTRAADVTSVASLSSKSWFSTTEGTIVGDWKSYANQTAAETYVVSVNTSGERLDIGTKSVITNLQANVVVASSDAVTLTNTVTANARAKMAFSFKSGNFVCSVNGAAVVTDTEATFPTGMTQFEIGNLGGSLYFYGVITSLTYYPTIRTNAELLTLSAL